MTDRPTSVADASNSARLRLLKRIERRYRLVTETVSVGSLSFPFTRVADPDKVLDEVVAEEDRLEKTTGVRVDGDYLHLPYWAELWDSAMGVAQHLAAQQSMPKNVLDLGCGMGLSGTVAARLGASVLFADLETAPLLFARLNSLPNEDRVRTRKLDWRTDLLDERFDLILGADILYERKQWEHLERFWRWHLSATAGQVLLGEPGRATGDLFCDWVRAQGWDVKTLHQSVATRPNAPIRLFQLSIRSD